jgi:hypothetical protein
MDTYVEPVLAPTPSAGQAAVLHNLTARRGARVRELSVTRGYELLATRKCATRPMQKDAVRIIITAEMVSLASTGER